MALPGVAPTRLPMRLLLSGLAVAVLPTMSSAGWPGRQRSLADKLRFGPGVANHPVNVVPSAVINIPEGWPLDVDGSLTCVTCHESLPSLVEGAAPKLRDFEGDTIEPTEFCVKCHSQSDQRSATALHWMAVRVAHVVPGSSRTRGPEGALDAPSRRCLACHDGVTALDSNNPTGHSRAAGSFADPGRNHPIGIRYSQHARRKSNVALRPASMLPAEVRLPGGKVSCVSCHDLYSDRHALLSVPIRESALCFTCHELD